MRRARAARSGGEGDSWACSLTRKNGMRRKTTRFGQISQEAAGPEIGRKEAQKMGPAFCAFCALLRPLCLLRKMLLVRPLVRVVPVVQGEPREREHGSVENKTEHAGGGGGREECGILRLR